MLRIVIVVGKHFAKTYGILPKKFNSPWLVRRDFNEITNASEKLRGGGGNLSRITKFLISLIS